MKNHTDVLIFFAQRFVSEQKQIVMMADEKSPARIFSLPLRNKLLRNEDYYERYDVIIVGAGPGGIFSAYELTKKRQ